MMNRGPSKKQLTWDGTQLKDWREKHNITHQYAADVMGVGVSSYYAIESGVRSPTFETAHKIVLMTRGEIRYRDIYLNFLPEYA